MNEGEDSAARSALGDALEPLRSDITEGGREVGHDEEMIFFGNASGLLVVLGDGFVLVAQVHLDDFLDVLALFGQPFLDLVALGPDAAVDETLLVIAEMHQAGEVLPEAYRIDDGEAELAGRGGRKQAQDDVVQGTDDFGVARVGGFKEKRALTREVERERNRHVGRPRKREAGIFGEGRRQLAQIEVEMAESRGRGELGGCRPVFDERRAPRGKLRRGLRVQRVNRLVDRHNFPLPVGLDLVPADLFIGRQRGRFGGVGFDLLLFQRGGFALEMGVPGRTVGFDLLEFRRKNAVNFLKNTRRLRFELLRGGRNEFGRDLVGAGPLLLNFRAGPFMGRLDLLADRLARCGHGRTGGAAGIDDPAGLPERLGNDFRRRFGTAQPEEVNEPDKAEQDDGGDSGDDQRRVDCACPGGVSGIESAEVPGERRRRAEDQQEENGQWRIAEKAGERKPVELAELFFRRREMPLDLLEVLA